MYMEALEVCNNTIAGGIPCHQWNIHIDGHSSVFRAKSQNHEKSNTELESIRAKNTSAM